MNLQIVLNGNSVEELLSELETAKAALVGEAKEEKDVISPSKLKAKAKVKAVEEDDDEDQDDETDEDESDEDEENDGDEDEETDEDSDDEDSDDDDSDDEDDDDDVCVNAKELKQLQAALNAYSVKTSKAKAVKMLHKYAKKSQEVKKADLPKLLKALK